MNFSSCSPKTDTESETGTDDEKCNQNELWLAKTHIPQINAQHESYQYTYDSKYKKVSTKVDAHHFQPD
jgi:hypothetical protein